MNKKLLFGLFAAFSMLFATSCQEEPAANLGNEGTVTFKVKRNAPAAIADGVGANYLVWEVYDAEGNELTKLSGEKEAFAGNALTETVEFKLAKGQTYSFAFFAYNTESGDAYDATDLKNIKINYQGITSQLENRDAFFGNLINYTVDGDSARTVELNRPFAQLNFGVEKADFDAAVAAGITVANSKVVVNEVATAFSAFDGTVSGTTEVEFALAAILTDDLMVDLDGDGTDEDYKYLSMNYILPYAATTGYESTTSNVEFTFTTNAADIVIPVENAPLQRNWRTNIIGSLLSTGKFTITIDPVFAGENNNGEAYSVLGGSGKRYKTLNDALKANESEIELSAGEYTLGGVNVTTPTLTISSASTDAVVKFAAKTISMKGADATFNNITIVGINDNYVGMQHAGDMTYNNCVIENQIFCYSEGDAKSEFNNCTFKQESSDWYNIWTYASNVDFNYCVFNSAGKAALVYAEGSTEWKTVNFKGCEFHATTPVAGKAAIEIDSSLHPYYVNIDDNCTAEGFGFGSVSNNPLYNLKKGEEGVNCILTAPVVNVSSVENTYYLHTAAGMEWFANEVNEGGNTFAGKTVKLAGDINLAGIDWEPVGQTGATQFLGTFDGQGYTISNLTIDSKAEVGGTYSSGLFGWIERHGSDADYLMAVKNLTVKGATVEGHHNVAVIAGYLIGTIENCHVTDANIVCSHANDEACGDKAGVIAGIAAEAMALIKDCTAANSTVKAGRDAGQIVGACIVGKVENCSAENVTVEALGDCTGANVNNALIGRTN